jgi:hypothetical protein
MNDKEGTMTRRDVLNIAATAGLGASSLALNQPAVAKSGDRIPLRFDDPIWNREASARLAADTDSKRQVWGSAYGVLNAVIDGQKVRPILRFDVFSSTRVVRQPDASYQRLSREVVFYRDIATNQIVDEWTNPLTNERVRVVDIANDPFNYTISEFFPDPPSYGGLNKEKPPKRPFLLNWGLAGDDTVTQEADINLFYPSALQPDKWPRESPGRMSQVSEYFRYVIKREDLENPGKTHVPSIGTWVRVTPWLPWMLMDQAPGHMLYVGTMLTRTSLDGVPPDVLERVRQRYPKYLTAPEVWEEPSLSSLEHYAREQTPAPPRKAP